MDRITSSLAGEGEEYLNERMNNQSTEKERRQEVLDLTDSAEVWEKLESQYKSKSLATRVHIKKQFYGLRLSKDGSFEKHLDDFNRIVTQMSTLDDVIKEEDKALVLLASLPASYNHIVTTLLFGKDTLKLDEVIASLLMNESRRSQGTSTSSHSEVLVIESKG
ncbi:hypothetical protein Nepgr_031677 [Nepenthes gracilis]|uniref:Retrovirus-related Pol polyprotein from transposon TNT 1-94 n=1 Tax=Nepenthes gracilis TaxID=150966 RepID=A0AAD3Y7A7_NEPGR|nr:hypothetical protein Nepgr_031677 [Nepenthes gracilis]